MKKLTLLFIVFLLAGCLSVGDLPEPPKQLDVPVVEKGIAKSVQDIGKAVHKTKAAATENEILATEIEKTSENETIKRYSTKIAGNSADQISNMDIASSSIEELTELSYQIQLMQKWVKNVKTQYDIMEDQNEDMRAQVADMKKMLTDISLQTDKNFAIIMNVIMILGGGIFVGGIAMLAWGLYTGSGMVKTGMLFAGIGIAVLSSAYFMGSNPVAVLVIGGVCVLGLIIYLIVLLYRHRHALEETVESMETVKKHGWTRAKEKINHSNFTKHLVHEAKIKKDIIENKIKKATK